MTPEERVATLAMAHEIVGRGDSTPASIGPQSLTAEEMDMLRLAAFRLAQLAVCLHDELEERVQSAWERSERD